LQVPKELRARQGDRRGAGEGLQQLDLLIAEWTDLETQQAEHAEWGALVEQRDRQVGSIPPPPLEVARERILGQNRGLHVVDVERAPLQQCATRGRAPRRGALPGWIELTRLVGGAGPAVQRDLAQAAVLEAADVGVR